MDLIAGIFAAGFKVIQFTIDKDGILKSVEKKSLLKGGKLDVEVKAGSALAETTGYRVLINGRETGINAVGYAITVKVYMLFNFVLKSNYEKV